MKKRLAIVAAAMVLAAFIVAGKMYYDLAHLTIVTPAQKEAITIALKGSLGEAIFGNSKPGPAIEGTGLDALFAKSRTSEGQGLIAAYQKDPEKYRKYSQLLDTAINAKRVGRFVEENRSNYKLPIMSSVLSLRDTDRLDAWGHPYCVIAFKDGIAVVSAGPKSPSFACGKQRTQPRELASARREIFQASSGEVIVLVGVSRGRLKFL